MFMATPQITLRVPKKTKDEWARAAEEEGTNVSEVIRTLMDEWLNNRK